MDTATHLDALDSEGRLLREAAERAGLDTEAPTCPGWQVRDLVRHVGQVHRWAQSYLTTGRTTPPNEHDEPAEPPAEDDALLPWFHDGHATLVGTLRDAPDDLDCWAFLPAPSPRAFWSRRQAHETAVHRADAELAAGGTPTFDPAFAADGVDELLFGFFARPRGRLVADPPLRLGLRSTDTGDCWTMTIGPEARSATRDAAEGDCVVSGPASRLYLLLWNRADADGLVVDGDTELLRLWRDKAQITWR
jgi:uncharacterized protein (TIGR03083 family)